MNSSLNHVFRTIWSDALGTWVAVSEITRAKGKRSASSRIRAMRPPTLSLRLSSIAMAVACCLAMPVQANPVGGQVVNGQATFNTTGNTLTVTNTPGTIINWQNFSINANEVTHFQQQNAASTVLNRVVTNNPSVIMGTLSSNGQVYLVNANGIMFGAGSTVDVAGLVATSLNLSDADFLAGRHNYTAVPGAQNVSNAGNINAHQAGYIYLIAPNVENSGIITAPNGEILLAAGSEVQLVNSLDPNLRVSITAPAGNATNLGQLIAESGNLGLFGTMVRNAGVVSANSAVSQGGKIVFKASGTTILDAGSVTSATGTTGGTVMAEGNSVALLGNASVDASGTNGGGSVLIGGDAHGANAAVQNAQNTFVDAGVTIHADATQNGDGGKVVVWADNMTQFGGYISARGGLQGGNGGWVETSGKQWLGFLGLVDTTSTHGLAGSLLLDPTDITISTGVDSGLTWNGTSYSGTGVASILNVNTLQTQLGLTNVIVDANAGTGPGGAITVANAISWANANSLTLNAATTITTNAGATITNTGTGGLSMTTGSGSITLNAGVSLGGGAFTANAGGAGAVSIAGAISTGSGAVNLTSFGSTVSETGGGSISTSGTLTTSSYAGTTLNGANAVGGFSATNSMTGGISLNDTAPGFGLTITNLSNTGGGGISVTNAGVITIQGSAGSTVVNGGTGPVNLTTTGASGWIREVGGVIATSGTLTINNSSASGTNLNGGTNMIGTLNATDVGMVYVQNGTALNITGVTASDVLINNTAATTVNGAVTASNTVSLAAVGITNNSTIQGNLGVNLDAGAGTLANIGAGVSITNGGGTSTGVITLKADKMVLDNGVAPAGTVIAGAGTVNLSNSTLTNAVNIGSTLDTTNATLELSNAELATISTTGLLTIGSASNTGLMTISAPISVTEGLALANGGSIAVNGAVSSAGNLSMLAGGSASDISVAAAISSGNATATPTVVTLSAGNNILLGSTGSVSNGGGANTNATSVLLVSDSDGVGGGGIYLDTGSSINSNNGSILLSGGLNPTTTGRAIGNGTVTGAATFNSGIYVLGNITAGTGDVTMRGEGAGIANANADGITFAGGTLSSNGIVKIDGLAHGYSTSNAGVPIGPNWFAAGVDFAGTGTLLTTQSGAVTITGVNDAPIGIPGAQFRADGVMLETGAIIETTGAGTLTLNGTANSLDTSWGVGVLGTVRSTAAGGGNITINGTNNAQADTGIIVMNGSVTSNGGEIRLIGSSTTGTSVGLINATIGGANSGNILLKSTNTGLITIAAGTTSINAGANTVTFSSNGGAVTDSGSNTNSITAGALRLLGSGGYTLGSTANNVGTLAINEVGAISYANAGNLAIGSISSFDGTGVTTTSGVTMVDTPLTISSAGSISIGQVVNTGAGSVSFTSTGSSIIETAGGVVDTLGTLSTISATGTTLNNANLVATFSASNTTSGNISLVNNTGFTTSTITNSAAGGNISLTDTAVDTAITNASATISTNNGSITLTADKMNLWVANGAAINAGTGNVTLQNYTSTHAINIGSTVDTTAGTLELSQTELNTISSVSTLTIGNAANSGAITVSAPTTFGSNTSLVNGAGGIAINGATSATFNAVPKNLTLNTTGIATQTAGITAGGLELLGTGSYVLTDPTNAVTTVAGNMGSMSLANSAAFTVGTVNATSGLTASGDITLIGNGPTSTITVANPISSGNVLTFMSAGGGGVETGAGTITAAALRLLGSGGYTFTNPLNSVGTLAINEVGAINYVNAGSLAFGAVSSYDGTAVTSTTGVTMVDTPLTVVANTGNITINSGAALNLGAGSAILAASAGNFINNSGSATPIIANSTEIWSSSPAGIVRGGMVPLASTFNCVYGGACTIVPLLGYNFIYASSAPVLTITANSVSKYLGQIDPTLTYTVVGLVGGDTVGTVLTGGLVRVAGETAGTYSIDQGSLATLAAYGYVIGSYVPGTFTIITPPAITPPQLAQLVNAANAFSGVEGGKDSLVAVLETITATDNKQQQGQPTLVCQ